LFTPHTHGVILHAHHVCGESWIQRNANGEVATIPFTNTIRIELSGQIVPAISRFTLTMGKNLK